MKIKGGIRALSSGRRCHGNVEHCAIVVDIKNHGVHGGDGCCEGKGMRNVVLTNTCVTAQVGEPRENMSSSSWTPEQRSGVAFDFCQKPNSQNKWHNLGLAHWAY